MTSPVNKTLGVWADIDYDPASDPDSTRFPVQLIQELHQSLVDAMLSAGLRVPIYSTPQCALTLKDGDPTAKVLLVTTLVERDPNSCVGTKFTDEVLRDMWEWNRAAGMWGMTNKKLAPNDDGKSHHCKTCVCDQENE